MRGFAVFFVKELRELLRTKRLLILCCLFLLFGIMNPAVAKLTPKLIGLMSEELAAQGMTVSAVTVTAMDSWVQFEKNIPFALIILLIMFSGIYTSEYSRGTLIPLLTKGLSRAAAVLSKCAVVMLMWTGGLALCFGLTYFYGDFYWDNSAVHSLFFAGFCWWLFGLLMIGCVVFFSSFAASSAQVLLGTGAVYFVMLLAGMYGRAKAYLPTQLCDSLSLFRGDLHPSDYTAAAVVTAALTAALILAALPLTKQRQI